LESWREEFHRGATELVGDIKPFIILQFWGKLGRSKEFILKYILDISDTK